ncbi:hypothetical protein [Sphingomonas lacusdianchii]|nr:hypothetical protein [Sphingomonas sp. JXJ CY 53]
MSRSLVILLVVVVALIAGMFLLAGRSIEQQPTQIEKAVSLENLAN